MEELIAETVRPWKHLPLKQRAIGLACRAKDFHFDGQLHIMRMMEMTKGEKEYINSRWLAAVYLLSARRPPPGTGRMPCGSGGIEHAESCVELSHAPGARRCYDLTGTDREPDKPAALEDRMPWNRIGSVLSPVSLKRKTTLARQIKNSFHLHEELLDLAGFCEKNHLPQPDVSGVAFGQQEQAAAPQMTMGGMS